MDPTQILSRLEGDNPPSDNELEKAAADIREALDVATKSEDPGDFELAKTLRQALDTLGGEAKKREEAKEAHRAELKKLREGVFDDDETKAEAEEKAPEAEKPEEKAPEAEAEKPAEEKEPVAAAGISDLVKRLKVQAAARTKTTTEEVRTVPSVHYRGLGTAASFDLGDGRMSDLGQLFATHAKSVTQRNSPTKLFSLTKDYDPSRQLSNQAEENNRKLVDVFGFGETTRPVTAAGGLCGPGEVDHSHPICADRGRPVRDSLVQFNAARGQVTYFPATGMGDVEGGVSIWTPQMDADAATPAGSGIVKPCPPVVCPDELVAEVDAVVRCLQIGNFQARFSPEFWASRLELLLAAHDRAAEQKSIEEIHEAAAGVVADNTGNNVIDNFLSNVNSIIASDRAIQRKLTGQYVVLTDTYVRDQLRNQVIRNLGVANNVETIQIADGVISGWLSDIGARAVWTPDGTVNETTGDHNIPTTVGTLPNATVYVYPEDAFFFLDGGTLDLGTEITDSRLNAQNNRQAFAETFEKTAFRGCSAYRFDLVYARQCGCGA